ncbi:hypothetical protein ACFE04_011393 [Oxalis oulophora]
MAVVSAVWMAVVVSAVGMAGSCSGLLVFLILGGYGVATGGPLAWGLCYKKEMSPSQSYCDDSDKYKYPCSPGADYYGPDGKWPGLKNAMPTSRFRCSKVRRAWEKWRSQITKLDCSAYWVQCGHRQTRDGLRSLLQVMLGNTNSLSTSTCNWIGLENMYSLAQKCIQLKPASSQQKLLELIIGILAENIEVVLATCSKEFGPWMAVHAIELLTASSDEAENLLHDEHQNLGGIKLEELHRLIYAQVLSSHALTWQLKAMFSNSDNASTLTDDDFTTLIFIKAYAICLEVQRKRLQKQEMKGEL